MQIQQNECKFSETNANSAKWMQIQRNGCKFSETDANLAKWMQIQRNGCKFSKTDANSAKRMQIQRNGCKFREAEINSAKRTPTITSAATYAARIEQGLGPTQGEPAISHTFQPCLQRIISSTLQLPGVVAAAVVVAGVATAALAGAISRLPCSLKT